MNMAVGFHLIQSSKVCLKRLGHDLLFFFRVLLSILIRLLWNVNDEDIRSDIVNDVDIFGIS